LKYTQNFNLTKPEGTDLVNIDDLNYNADEIDTELAARIKNGGGVPSIQAGLDAEKPVPGTAGGLYIATDKQIIYRDTGSAWQKIGVVNWNDISGKPTSFTPNAHKNTHAIGGTDVLTPQDIGAAAQTDFAAHAADSMPHRTTDPTTGKVYHWGLAVQNGEWGIIYEEVV